MKEIIQRFVNNDKSSGLILVDMPTGSGKTYSAVEYMYDVCREEIKDRRILFITTQKKNLPYSDLRDKFDKNGMSQLYDDNVLFLDSNMDSVTSAWEKINHHDIPPEITKTDEYKRLRTDVDSILQQRKMKNALNYSLMTAIGEDLRIKAEPEFRRMLTSLLGKLYRTPAQRLQAIKTEKKWQWVGELYPAVFTSDRRILFLSMDKFLARNSTIIEPAYSFLNSELIKAAIVIIDEFDATKDTILKNLIANGLRDKIDYVELFNTIHSALITDVFPADLTRPSRERQEGAYKDQKLDDIITKIREMSEATFNSYSLMFRYKMESPNTETGQNFMFQDHQYHSILRSDNSYISVVNDRKEHLNSIRLSKEKPKNQKNTIQELLGELRGFIRYFEGAVNILSINYMQLKNERQKEGTEQFTREEAIRTVLHLFNLKNEQIDHLTYQILLHSNRGKNSENMESFDLSFYENGFRYYAFEDDTEHDMQSRIMMYSFRNTPEKILLKLCEKAKVIGISATATVPSVISNFDIRYLKGRLQDRFESITPQELKRLRKEFEEGQQGYRDIRIHAELLGEAGTYSVRSWAPVFHSEELCAAADQEIGIQLTGEESHQVYIKERYLRICQAYCKFITHADIRSFLCILTKQPKCGDRELNRDTLLKLFTYINQDNLYPESAEDSVCFLNGTEYDVKRDKVLSELSAGKKRFVISAYQTLGAGQNLQYGIPNNVKDLVQTNSRPSRNEKDFDAIYLDKPTNVITNIVDGISSEEFIRYIYQMEFLQETAEIAPETAIRNIKYDFRTYMNGRRPGNLWPEKVTNKQSVVLASTRYIIQAIGRICRTNCKNKNIYIYADNRIAECLDTGIVEGRIFNHEFMELVKCIRSIQIIPPEQASLAYEASLKAVRVNKEIRHMLSNDWNGIGAERWKALRGLVLKSPTASAEEASGNIIIRNFYAQLPEKGNALFYNQSEDYNSVSVSFQPGQEHPYAVTAGGSRLYDMINLIPGVREYFTENGWATDFAPNDYLMVPPLWNNIYKGALGEVVGKYLFKQMLGIELEEITEPEYFELFDYKVPGLPIYVDFKNWNEGQTENSREVIEKIKKKAHKCGCRCVIIANVISEHWWQASPIDIDGIRIITAPALFIHSREYTGPDQYKWQEIGSAINEYRYQNQ